LTLSITCSTSTWTDWIIRQSTHRLRNILPDANERCQAGATDSNRSLGGCQRSEGLRPPTPSPDFSNNQHGKCNLAKSSNLVLVSISVTRSQVTHVWPLIKVTNLIAIISTRTLSFLSSAPSTAQCFYGHHLHPFQQEHDQVSNCSTYSNCKTAGTVTFNRIRNSCY